MVYECVMYHPQRKSVDSDELLVVLITTNFSECHGSGYTPQTPLVVNGTGEKAKTLCLCVPNELIYCLYH